MAVESDQGERTEEATQQRREDFRKRGQVAQTRELASGLGLFLALGLLGLFGLFFFQQIHSLFLMAFGDGLVGTARGVVNWMEASQFAVQKTFLMTAPIMGI